MPNSETGRGRRLRHCPTVKWVEGRVLALPNSETGRWERLITSPTVKRVGRREAGDTPNSETGG